jgi:GNAT superfamily N-acetyltransferase
MTAGRRTYLEMRDPSALRPARVPHGNPTTRLEARGAPSLYRALYLGVGGDYRWTDRAGWSDEQIEAHLATPGLELWTLRVDDDIGGFFELEPRADRSVQIAYFGLLPAFVGRGLGGFLCTEAVRRAWALGPERVWLHTCTFDHPAALPNYLARGFSVTRVEDYETTDDEIGD